MTQPPDSSENPADSNSPDDDIGRLSKKLFEQLEKSEIVVTVPSLPEPEPTAPDPAMIDHIRSFNQTPKSLKSHLDQFVIGQEEAKKVLSIAICDHYNAIQAHLNNDSFPYIKQNILMIGPTGVGKTYLIETIANFIGVPFVKSDATKFTETGYQGGDVEDLVRQLYKKANNQLALAEFGIIYLDEVDKITGAQSRHHKDVSGRGVQTNLLKIMENTDVPLRPPWDIQSQMKQMMGGGPSDPNDTIATKHILFIMSGAFNDLDTIIQKRLAGSSIGFKQTHTPPSDAIASLSSLRTKDLVQFGLEPEFAGRLPIRVALHELSADHLCHILTHSKQSIVPQLQFQFKQMGIELLFRADALQSIASLAKQDNIGARALMSIIEKIFRDYKFECPDASVSFMYVTSAFIDDPKGVLNQYLCHTKKQWKTDILAYATDIGIEDTASFLAICQSRCATDRIQDLATLHLQKS